MLLDNVAKPASWENEFASAIKSVDQLNLYLGTDLKKSHYPLFIPSKIAKRIKQLGPTSSLWKQFIPHDDENNDQQNQLGLIDPIGDKVNLKHGQIIHRYHNRCLFMPINVCPIICRFCFRKNELSFDREIFSPAFDKTIKYLKDHKEINEIIFSGGDPFILSDHKIENYLKAFSEISHIKYIRFHTKILTTLPSRITPQLLKILGHFKQRFSTINIVAHINHADEIDSSAMLAIEKIQQVLPQILSQSVLLKEVNNSNQQLLELFNQLIKNNIRPYYLHHPDFVKGAMHFYLPQSEGLKLYHNLRQHLPGWAIPHYVFETENGSGKMLVTHT